jgi:hypothetical protein
MAKKTASTNKRAKQVSQKTKAKKKKPSQPAKKTDRKPAKPKPGKNPPQKPAAKRPAVARPARKASKTLAAVSPSRSGAVTPTSPGGKKQRTARVDQNLQKDTTATPQTVSPAPATSDSIENMRKGLAFIDQQRVINNLDREPGGEAPTPTGPGHEPANARFVAHHAVRLEGELDHGAEAIKALEGENRQRRMMWDLGCARKPRAVVVGRALHELRATSWEDASRGENYAIVNRIHTRGPHHLNETLANLLRSHDSKASTDATAALATHVNPALELLQAYGWLKARTRGVYLVGDGLTLFVNFPDWAWQDEEPPKLRRIPGHRKPS